MRKTDETGKKAAIPPKGIVLPLHHRTLTGQNVADDHRHDNRENIVFIGLNMQKAQV
jgi:hypothetical protein